MAKRRQDIEWYLSLLERQVLKMVQGLSEEQMQELRDFRSLLHEAPKSPEVEVLHDRISIVGDTSSRIHSTEHLRQLEQRYDEIDAEYRDPATTSKRREELIREQRPISEELRMLTQ